MKKRIISLILMFSLVLSFTSFAEETTTKTQYTEEMKLIQSIDIIPDGLNPDDFVSRGRFAKMIVDLLFRDIEILFELETDFSDLDFSKEYYNSVLVLEKLHIINGGGGGKFSPDDMISYQDAVTMLTKALGYTLYAESMGGYPTGYIMAAKKIGILSNVRTQEVFDYKLASKLIYNALFTAPVSFTTVTDEGVQATVNYGTDVLLEYLDMKKVKGQLIDDGIASVDNSSPQEETITIQDEQGLNLVLKRNGINVSEFLGCNVNAFYKIDESDAYELVFISLDDKVQTITLTADYIADVASDLSEIEYITDKETMNTKKAKISSDSPLYFENGYKLSQVSKENIKIDDGFLKLIDNDGDNRYDVIIITSVAFNIIVNSFNETSTMLICKYSPINSIDLSDTSKTAYRVFDSNGPIALTDIKEDDVISVAPSKYKKDGIQIYYLYRSDVKEEVVLNSKDENSNVVSTDEKDYNISPTYLKSNSNISKLIKLNYTYTVYLNTFGDIAYVEALANTGVEYAYLLNLMQQNSNEEVKLALYNRYNNMNILSVSSKVVIDGKRLDSKLINGTSCSMFDEVRELLSVRSDGEVYIRSQSDASLYNQNNTAITPRLAIVKVNSKGEVYYIDTDAPTYENDPSFEKDDPFVLTSGDRQCRIGQMSVDTKNAVALPSNGSFITDSSTYILSVPDVDRFEIKNACGTYGYSLAHTNEYELPLFDMANYRTPAVTDLKRAHYYDLQPYNVNEDTGVASVLLLRGHNDWGDAIYNENAKNYVIFKKLTKYYNESIPDADYYKLYYVTMTGAEGSILIDKDYIQEDFKNIIFGGTSIDTAGNIHTVNKLTPGDVIYFTNDDRSLVNIVRLLNVKKINQQTLSVNGASTKAQRYYAGAQANVIPYEVKFGAAAQISYGNTYSYDLAVANQLSGMSLSVWYPKISSTGYLAPIEKYYDGTADTEQLSYLYVENLISGNIMVVEETECNYPSGECETRIRKGTLQDIKFLENDIEHKVENASKLFFYKSAGTPTNMIIYNLKDTHK